MPMPMYQGGINPLMLAILQAHGPMLQPRQPQQGAGGMGMPQMMQGPQGPMAQKPVDPAALQGLLKMFGPQIGQQPQQRPAQQSNMMPMPGSADWSRFLGLQAGG